MNVKLLWPLVLFLKIGDSIGYYMQHLRIVVHEFDPFNMLKHDNTKT